MVAYPLLIAHHIKQQYYVERHRQLGYQITSVAQILASLIIPPHPALFSFVLNFVYY